MESQSNSTNKNSNPTTSFSIGGSLTVGANLVTGGNFGDNANLSYTNVNYSQSNQSIPLVPINNNVNQPVEEDNLQEQNPNRGYCCIVGGMEIGCGSIPLFCCHLEPTIKFASLMCCCWKSKEQVPVQQNVSQQQENVNQQPKPTAQMQNTTAQQSNQQEQQVQIQVPPK